VHGGLQLQELRGMGIAPEHILDVSVCCNPYGPYPPVVDAIRSAPLDGYPDPRASFARAAIASLHGLAAEQIALGNGAAELLWTLARTLLRPGDCVVTVEPTFSEFRSAAICAGAVLQQWRARPENDFAVDLDTVARLVDACAATVVYLCAPNNPTGVAIPISVICEFAQRCGDVTIVLDQSFLSLSEGFADAEHSLPPNLVAIRSMTKEHTIPGVRVGYALGSPAIIAAMERHRPAWTTSSLAQAAAVAACGARAFVDESRARLLSDRCTLVAGLRAIGLAPVPSTTGFVLVRTGAATSLRSRLLQRHHILVRDCTSFALPDFLRLAARPQPEGRRLITALEQELPR
jgi:histidinol-phosphate aminotransferase